MQTDVASAYLALLSSEQNVTLANQEVENAREGIGLSEGRYSAGLGPFQDVLTAQSLLVGALTDKRPLKLVDQAKVQLKHAIGQVF